MIVNCIILFLCCIPCFLDYLPLVLLISDRTYLWVQFEGRNKMRADSINFCLVRRVPSKCTWLMSLYAQILGTYSAVQCMSTYWLDKQSQSSKSSSFSASHECGCVRGVNFVQLKWVRACGVNLGAGGNTISTFMYIVISTSCWSFCGNSKSLDFSKVLAVDISPSMH